MASNAFKLTLLGLTLIPISVGIVVLRQENSRLRQRIGEQRRQDEQSDRLREENRRTENLVAQLQAGEADGARAIRADIARAQGEIAALEENARLVHARTAAQAAADAEALTTNRDPEKGPVQLESFQNVGQQTPAAAFQTVVWAAVKGEEAMLAGLLGLSPEARVKAEALLAGMSAVDRAQWTPEKLGTLFVSEMLNEVPALQIAGIDLGDGGRSATLSLRMPSVAKLKETTVRIPMQRGPNGWQVVLTERNVDQIVRKIQGPGNSSPPR